ncbi:MAG: SRPBCC family protein [Polyangiales bacterium]
MASSLGAEFRRVEDREYEGKPAIVVVATRRYDTDVEDLWDAIVTPARLRRWFLPIEGELRVGGRYQLQGNAGGTIKRCDAPEALDLTWEFGGGISWVTVRLAADGPRTRLTLEHIAHRDGPGEEHMKRFGPGAVGVGWDLALNGLGKWLRAPEGALDPRAEEAWCSTDEGKAAIRASGEAWAEAFIASGADGETAREQARNTISFYTGG